MNQAALQLDFRDDYPDGFFAWLAKNQSIYIEFEKRALRVALMGRKRYSAKTIVESIRWDTELRDKDVLFKINNTWTAGMARLWMETHGHRYPKFFELRA